MAKFLPGPIAGAVSGSIGGTVFSHNKGGPYFRRRAIPTTTPTVEQLLARARLVAVSQYFASLTPAQALAWRVWADNTPIVNTLGQTIKMTAHQAFVQINALRLKLGDAILTVPVQGVAPSPMLTITLTADVGAGSLQVAFTPTPLPAATRLYFRAWLVDSPRINYVKNKLVFIGNSTAAAVSPVDIEGMITAKFALPLVGQTLFAEARAYSNTTGLTSAPLLTSAVVTST